MPTVTTTRSARWAGIVLLVALGLLGLHLPHYFAETASPAGYAAYPGLILVLMMVVVVIAAVAIARNRRVGWHLGTGVAIVSVLLYVIQETVGLPGLSQTWYEPTRLLSLLLAGGFMVLAYRLTAR